MALRRLHGSRYSHPSARSCLRRRQAHFQYIMYTGQPTYSAALTAFIELGGGDDEQKNSICRPLPVTGDLSTSPATY